MAHQCATRGCGCPTETTICRACTADLEHLLRELLPSVRPDPTSKRKRRTIPGLAAELRTTMSRQSVHGGHGGRRSAEKPMAYDVRASDADAALRAVLGRCVRHLIDQAPEPHPHADLAATARWLLERVSTIAAHADAGVMLGELRGVIGKAKRAIAGPTPRIPLGVCGALVVVPGAGGVGTCAAELTIANMDEAHARCRACRAQHDVPGRIDRVRTEASGMLLPIRDIARLAAFLGEASDTARTERLINVWATRGRIARVGTSQSGRALYRAGEALDRLRAVGGPKSAA